MTQVGTHLDRGFQSRALPKSLASSSAHRGTVAKNETNTFFRKGIFARAAEVATITLGRHRSPAAYLQKWLKLELTAETLDLLYGINRRFQNYRQRPDQQSGRFSTSPGNEPRLSSLLSSTYDHHRGGCSPSRSAGCNLRCGADSKGGRSLAGGEGR
jgi:hypothetical protein